LNEKTGKTRLFNNADSTYHPGRPHLKTEQFFPVHWIQCGFHSFVVFAAPWGFVVQQQSHD
jgi:hypothetical protein